jgi:hypothetical protein
MLPRNVGSYLQTTPKDIIEDRIHNIHCRENFKYLILSYVLARKVQKFSVDLDKWGRIIISDIHL